MWRSLDTPSLKVLTCLNYCSKYSKYPFAIIKTGGTCVCLESLPSSAESKRTAMSNCKEFCPGQYGNSGGKCGGKTYDFNTGLYRYYMSVHYIFP